MARFELSYFKRHIKWLSHDNNNITIHYNCLCAADNSRIAQRKHVEQYGGHWILAWFFFKFWPENPTRAGALLPSPARVRFSARNLKKISWWDSMTVALLNCWWTVLRLNSHSNPSSTGESSAAKKELLLYSEHYLWEGLLVWSKKKSSASSSASNWFKFRIQLT